MPEFTEEIKKIAAAGKFRILKSLSNAGMIGLGLNVSKNDIKHKFKEKTMTSLKESENDYQLPEASSVQLGSSGTVSPYANSLIQRY